MTTTTRPPRALALLAIVLAAGLATACTADETRFLVGDASDVPVDAPDDGPPEEVVRFTLSRQSLMLGEGATETFTIALQETPRGNVTVRLTSRDPSKATVSPDVLEFAPANAGTPRTISVTAPPDPDATSDGTKISITSGASAEVQFNVDIVDDDRLDIEAEHGQVTVTEESADGVTLNVRLTAQPPEDLVVTASSLAPAIATAAPAQLTFTVANWNQHQPVTIRGVGDVGITDHDTSVTLAATNLAPVTVGVHVTDDDALNIVAEPGQITVAEGGTADTIRVVLTKQPPANLVVAVTSADTTAARVTPAQLTFTPANFATAQIVTVTPQADVDTRSETTTVNFRASAPTQPAPDLQANVSVRVTDPNVQGIVLDLSSATVTENGNQAVRVHLAFQPNADVAVTLTTDAAHVATITPATLTFTTGNYAQDQIVQIHAEEDANITPGSATITVSSTGLPSQPIAINVTDNDVARITTTLPNNAISLAEGETPRFRVALGYQPDANVVVALASTDPGAASVSPTTLTFTPTSYSEGQEVIVTGVQDPDTVAETVILNLTGPASLAVTATVADDDRQELVVSSLGAAITDRATSSATFTVALQFMPAANVTVAVASSAPGVATVGPAMLTFTPQNYLTGQPVTVTGVQDANVAPNDATITLSSSGVTPRSFVVTVGDVDTQALVVTPTSLTATEGTDRTFTVRLAFQPSANVSVAIASADSTIAAVTPPALTFTSASYATAQTVTVRGSADADTVSESVDVTVSSANLASQVVHVMVPDSTQLNIVLSRSAVALREEETTDFFDVHLSAPPTGNVTVGIASGDGGAATTTPTSLSFTPTDFSTPRRVTVNGIGDADLANETVTLTLTAGGIPPQTVTAAVTDNDRQALVVNLDSLNLIEGGAALPFTVALAFQPAANVVVDVASNGTAVATVSRPQGLPLTFTPANYATPQTVTVTPVADTNLVQDTTTISVTSPGLTNESVAVAVADRDQQTFVVTTPGGASPLIVNENTTGSFTVRLGSNPGAAVTTTIATAPAGVATFTPATISFNASNWSVAQTVTVTPVADSDSVPEDVTWSISAAGIPQQQVAVRINDTTQEIPFGWRAAFTADAATFLAGTAIAYKVSFTGAPATLDNLGIVTSAAGADFRLAVYTDAGAGPGNLIGATATGFQPSVAGPNTIDIIDTALTAGSYWIAVSVRGPTNIGAAIGATETTTVCDRGLASNATWPASWGTPACSVQNQNNLFGRLYR